MEKHPVFRATIWAVLGSPASTAVEMFVRLNEKPVQPSLSSPVSLFRLDLSILMAVLISLACLLAQRVGWRLRTPEPCAEALTLIVQVLCGCETWGAELFGAGPACRRDP